MDGSDFDRLTRAIAQSGTRRWLVRLVAGLPVVGVLTSIGDDAAGAERPNQRLGRRTKQRNRKQRTKRRQNKKQHQNNNQNNPNGGGGGNNNGGNGGRLRDPGPCTPNGGACTQNSDCCGGNCFGQVCAAPPATCLLNGSSQTCTPAATGCCAGDGCCQPPANQCNTSGGQAGLCCAPNCNGRQCGDDGCGNTGTCGSCLPGQTCSANGTCQGQPTCSPQSCPNGCCASNGTCQPGNTNQVCGTAGAPCERCGAGQACLNRRCVACIPNCTGKVCGPDGCGGSCGTCPTGLACDDGSGRCLCTTASCPNGCCSDSPGNPGACLPGDTDQSCNKGGLRCVACAAGSTCGGRGCQPVDCRNLCGSDFCLNLVEGNVACNVPLTTVCNDTEPDLTSCTSTAECAARDDFFTLCVASYTDPTTNQTEVLFCGGQPTALCASSD